MESKPEAESTPMAESSPNGEDNVGAPRAVAFHAENEIEEKPRPKGMWRPDPCNPPSDVARTGVELKHTLTQDDKELAAAGYGHLADKNKKAGIEEANVDIHEHKVPLANLGETLSTSIDPKDPGASHGLTAAEALARLQRDGPNILTPPKKRSPFRQVSLCSAFVWFISF
jgi:sodium/potassium-transporting ATPase subunit alpha